MANPNEQGLTYSLTYKDVVEILQLLNESSHCESIELEFDGLRLSATRALAAAAGAAAPRAPAASAQAPEAWAQSGEQAEGGEVIAKATTETGLGLIEIRSPMLGTFYRAPAPGEPPYVEAGDVVDADTVIGLIDVMKLFTQIPAGVAGRVVEIVARDAVLVEYGQPLVLIEPLS